MSTTYNDQWLLPRPAKRNRGARLGSLPRHPPDGSLLAQSWARAQDCSRWALGSLAKSPRWIDRDT